MKRIFALLLITMLLCAGLQSAQASFSREDWYAMGLSSLEEMTPEAAAMAVEYFDAAGTYEQAKRYKQYAQCMGEIFAMDSETPPDMAMTKYRLKDLAQFSEFVASLSEHDLPSCADLLTYLEARELEREGHYAQARRNYLQVSNVLDATERRYDLTSLAYDEGKALFESGDFEGAADALEGLDWLDSDALFQQAALIARPEPTPVQIPLPEQDAASALPIGIPAPVVKGDTITLGYYEQDTNLGNGLEPIEWLVLDVDHANHRALLISSKGLDSLPFHETLAEVTWETCDLRTWLNTEFLETAFSSREQSLILTTQLENSNHNTEDKIFLLSSAEAERCFDSDSARKGAPTAYAAALGAQSAETDSGWWWLRSPGSAGDRACFVRFGGSTDELEVNQEGGMVRPAFWIAIQPAEPSDEETPVEETPEATPVPEEEPLSLVLSVTASEGCNALSWNTVSGAESYEVSRHMTDTPYVKLADTPETHYDDTNVRAGYRYYYTVIVHLPDGRTVISNEVVVISPRKPSRPTPTPTPAVSQDPVSEETFTLTVFIELNMMNQYHHLAWDPVPGANSYEILRHTADEDEYDTLTEVNGTIHEYDDGYVLSGVRYYYTVVAHRIGSNSVTSNEVVVIGYRLWPLIVRTEAQPDELTLAVERKIGSHILTWNAISNADHYEIWRHMTNGTYAEPLVDNLSGTSYEDTSIQYGYRYYYTVKAVYANGSTITSNEVIVVALQREKTTGVTVTVYYVNDKDSVMGSKTVACHEGENLIYAPSTYQGLKLIDYSPVCVMMYGDNSLSQKVVYFHYK